MQLITKKTKSLPIEQHNRTNNIPIHSMKKSVQITLNDHSYKANLWEVENVPISNDNWIIINDIIMISTNFLHDTWQVIQNNLKNDAEFLAGVFHREIYYSFGHRFSVLTVIA